ncbi:hypothetical protein [Leptospira koniambonensis]|uniref:hypothetical protein n=1 Tax=Leptospira koniambonensis TaxID=2484950 RepID=UPI003EBDA93A
MKLMFWNTQRLGQSTDDASVKLIQDTIAKYKPDLHILCELTTSATAFTPQNLNYRRPNDFQLCYSYYDARVGKSINLIKIVPESTDDYKEALFKGGNDFTRIADRALAYAGRVGGVHLYALHAPASGNALKAASFVACHLNESHQEDPWILIGDLNVTPDTLKESKVGIDLNSLILDPGIPTHIKGKTLDYALSNIDIRKDKDKRSIQIGVGDLNKDASDHAPIILTW